MICYKQRAECSKLHPTSGERSYAAGRIKKKGRRLGCFLPGGMIYWMSGNLRSARALAALLAFEMTDLHLAILEIFPVETVAEDVDGCEDS